MKILFSLRHAAAMMAKALDKEVRVHPFSGYGHAETEIRRALERFGIETTDDPDESDSCDLELHVGQPNNYPMEEPLVRPAVLLTMFETTRCPADWPEKINRTFDHVINPSRWGADSFRECGVQIPVHVLPLGVNTERFCYHRRSEGRPWTFLWRGLALRDRKGFSLVRTAFEQLNLPHSRLVSKTVPQKNPDVPFDITIPAEKERGQQWDGIRLCIAYLSWEKMLEMLHTSDVSCNPTSGEGFGLIPLEDAATGMYTIVTDYSGPADFARPCFMEPLDYREGISTYFRHFMGNDAKPSLEHLKSHMLWSYENQDDARHIGWLSSQMVRRYDWNLVIQSYIDLLKELAA